MAEKDIVIVGSDDIAPPPINIVNFESYRMNSSWSHHEIVEEIEEEDDGHIKETRLMPGITEATYRNDLFYNITDPNESEVVYVVAWAGTEELLSASMDALVWTLASGYLRESGIVYLVHVFPELRFIPTPLGMLPISQANPEQKEGYMSKERSKRSAYLQKFLSVCSSSKVHVETVLIESDIEAKAILNLIPILNITKLVMGATKSNLRKLKSSNKKGGSVGTLDQILHNVPGYCDVKVICEGKEVSLHDQLNDEPPFSPSSTAPSPRNTTLGPMLDHTNGFVSCSCFKI